MSEIHGAYDWLTTRTLIFIIRSIVIDYLEEKAEGGSSLVLFAYIRDDQRTMHTLRNVLCALLLQLLRKQRSASNAVLALCRENDLPPLRRLLETFQAVLSSSKYAAVYIVVDALDEWMSSQSYPNTTSNLVAELTNLHHAKLLITSRYSIPFSSSNVYADVPISAEPKDVKAFVDHRISRGLLGRVTATKELLEEIHAKVQIQASGMYGVIQLFIAKLLTLASGSLWHAFS